MCYARRFTAFSSVHVVNPVRLAWGSESDDELVMRDLLNLIRWMLLGLCRSRKSLEAESRGSAPSAECAASKVAENARYSAILIA